MDLTEVFYGLAADLDDPLKIDGILSALSRTKGDREEKHIFFCIQHENSQKYIRKIKVLRYLRDIF